MMRRFFQKLLIMAGVLTCGVNVVAAIAMKQDVRACAIALLGLVFVQAAAAIGAVGTDDATTTDEAQEA